jgi:hypothetical protein
MAVEVVDVGHQLQPRRGGQRPRVDARSADDDHPQVGHALPRLGEGCDHPPQQVAADARAADGDHADALVVAVAELGTQAGAVREPA